MAGTKVLGRLNWRLAELAGRQDETPRVKTLAFSVPDWDGHRAGQHVDVRLTAEDGYQAQRSYSIASAPEDPSLMLTVERLADGEVSPYLTDELMVGEPVEVRGPVGGYFVWDSSQQDPLLLVAGGSGVVPLMSMIRHRAAAGASVPARLIFSSRSLEEIIYREELERLSSNGDGLEVFHTLTREQPPGWQQGRRRVDREMLKDWTWPPSENPVAFVCGPTAFVESVASDLEALGMDSRRIKTERFGPSGG